MNALDYAVITLMVISIGVGIVRGAIREVINVGAWVLAFVLAHTFAGTLAGYFAEWMSEPAYRMATAWLAIFMAVLIVAALIASLLSELVRKLGLSSLDRIGGALIGLARGALVILALTLAAGMTRFPQTDLWKKAASTPWLEIVALHARPLLPDGLSSRISYRNHKGQQVRLVPQKDGGVLQNTVAGAIAGNIA